MERMVEEIARHVLLALQTQETNRPAAPHADAPAADEDPMDEEAPLATLAQAETAASEQSPWPEPVHRVKPLRRRPGSILGLDFPSGPEEPGGSE